MSICLKVDGDRRHWRETPAFLLSSTPRTAVIAEAGERKELRRRLRAARAGLSAAERRRAAKRMTARLRRLPWWRRARHIALYHPVGAEIDPLPLATGRDQNKRFYVPVVGARHNAAMTFAPLHVPARWRRSGLGIREPAIPRHRHCKAKVLDLVVVPLLGFDADCNRLGQGAGHYDRSFAFHLRQPLRGGPRLVGAAFECQRVDALPAQPWDVPLDAVVTERHIYLR